MGIHHHRVAATFALAVLLAVHHSADAQRQTLRGQESGARPSARERTTANSRTSTFEAVTFSPRGPLTQGSVIAISFNTDVVSSASLESGDVPTSVFSFEPSIVGKVEWESLRSARFTPTKPLKQGTEYIVRINPELSNGAGQKLKDAPEYRFQTPSLTLKNATQVNFSDRNQVTVKLDFSDNINPLDLKKHLTLKSGDAIIPWKLTSEVATAFPQIITDPLTTDTLRIILEPGLRGVSGPLGLRNRMEQKVRLDFRLVATQMKGLWKNGTPQLRISFSASPSTVNVQNYITIDPPVKYTVGSSDESELVLNGDFRAEQRYAVSIKPGFRSWNSDKVMLEGTRLTAWMPDMSPFLELPQAGGYLGTQGRMKLRVRSAAMNAVQVEVRRVFDSNLGLQLNMNGWDSSTRYSRKVTDKTYPVEQKSGVVSSEIDLRDLLGAGATGMYALTVTGQTSQTENLSDEHEYYYGNRFEKETVINLSNLGLVAKKGPTETTVFVAALDTAKPVPAITVRLMSNRYQPLGEAVTDANGMAVISKLPEGDDDAEPALVTAQNKEGTELGVLDLRESLSGLEQFDNSGRNYLRSGFEAFVTSERGAYRPGETAHVTGFIRGKEERPPAPAFPVEIVVTRPDGKQMTPFTQMPSSTGLLSFDLSLPGYSPTGYYHVEVRMPGTVIEEDSDEY